MPGIWKTPTQFAELAAPAARKTGLYDEIATRQRMDVLFGSFFATLANPDPVLRKTGNAITVYNEIKRDAQVSACRSSRKSGVLAREWMVDPREANGATVELIEKALNALPMHKIVKEMLNAWGYGYQVSEVVWKREGNYILPDRIVGKPQNWFSFGKSNELRRRTDSTGIKGVEAEPRKFLLTQHEADYANPYGEAVFGLCFWPITFKKGGLKFWAKYLQKYGMPHAIGKLPRGCEANEREDLLEALTLMVQDACAVFPDDASVELVEAQAKGNTSDLYQDFAQYHDAEVSKAVLGHGAAVDSTPGRLGNENAALDVKEHIVDDDCDMVQDTFNRLIQWIYELNPTLGTDLPQFLFYEQEDVDQTLAERDKTLVSTGQLKFTKSYYRKAYDLDDDDIIVDEGAAAPMRNAAPEAPGTRVEFAGGDLPNSQKQLDNLIDQTEAKASLKDLLQPVETLLNEASSLEDFRDRLIEKYADLDAKALGAVIEQAMTAAELAGRFTVVEDADAA